jgi:tight adherence protein B
VRGLKGFVEDCELAEIEMSAAALAYLAVGAGVLFGIALAVGTGVPIAALAGIVVPIGVRQYVRYRVERKRRKFMEQLPDNLDVLAQALRAGHSLVGAISVVAQNADEPSATEFNRVVQDEQLGVNLEDALGSVVIRMQNRDLDQVAVVALLQRDAGGNAAEVIDQVAQNIRVRMELRRLVRVLTAQGRLARWILTLLPIALFLILLVISTEYLQPLWQKTAGIIGLIAAAILVTLGSQIIKKIVNIKV